MIDKYYLIKYVYNTPELTSNVFRFCDGALGGVLAGFASSTPKAPEEYTDYDWGMLYDKRVSDIDRAMRAYISASGTYDGDDVVSLIDQYNNIMEQLETARDLFIKYDARGQMDGGEECSFKQFLRIHLGVYGTLANDRGEKVIAMKYTIGHTETVNLYGFRQSREASIHGFAQQGLKKRANDKTQ